MATVELTFTPLPAHVRTARLVATAVARRSRVEESLLDEVRLAVGEACSRAVEAHRLYCPTEPIRIELSDRDGRFSVVVTDAAPSGPGGRSPQPAREHVHAATDSMATKPAPADVASSAVPVQQVPGEPMPPPGQGFVQHAHGQAVSAASTTLHLPGSVAAPAASGGGTGSDAAAASGSPMHGTVNGNIPADIGLAVIEGLADDVQISATVDGVSIRMSWPLPPAA